MPVVSAQNWQEDVLAFSSGFSKRAGGTAPLLLSFPPYSRVVRITDNITYLAGIL